MNKFKFLAIKIVGFICLSSLLSEQVQAQKISEVRNNLIDLSYLESRDMLKDYILDTGDKLYIKFLKVPEINSNVSINAQGEIYLERIKSTYVRGLTIKELTQLLEERYKEFLVDSKVEIEITDFKPIRVSITGEVKTPSIIRLSAYRSNNFNTLLSNDASQINVDNLISKSNVYVTTLSNAIQGAGGLTSLSDISKIEVIRNIPIGKGGGRKKAIIDFTSFLKNEESTNDIRLFDGDSIFIPSLAKRDPSIIPNSVIAGLSPKFISISITGQIENPGEVKIPLEGTLSDVMNLRGPTKPLSGKIYLIRYSQDGTLLRKNIKYVASAAPGSKNNPYLLPGDLITVKNSFSGRASDTLNAVTAPFVGIYSTKQLIDNF